MSKSVRLALAAALVVSAPAVMFAQVHGPNGIPNSKKYRDAGVKPSTGRSGSASLEARVLISKAGSMLIEASTGAVGSGAGPGAITRMQIKTDGITQNHNGLDAGGYFATTMAAAARGTFVQLQASVKGIDPHRAGVVTISTPAALRPDLAVSAVSGPAQHTPGTPVTFIAAVHEKNGDVGATTDCTLAVNDVLASAAPAIWVDAGGTVSCRFTHTFETPGTYAVSASAANVVPGDWDTANNSASTTIVIAEPGHQIPNGALDVEQRNTTERYLESLAGSYSLDRTYAHNYTFVRFQGVAEIGSAPIHTVNVALFGNGNLRHQASLAPAWWTTIEFPNFRSLCGHYGSEYWDGARWVYSRDYFTACSHTVGGGQQSTHSQFIYQQFAGDVVYFGSDTICAESECGTYSWLDGQSFGAVADLRFTAGTAVRLKLEFVDAAGARFAADRTVTLTDASAEVNSDSSGIWYDAEYGDVYWERRLWGVLFRGFQQW